MPDPLSVRINDGSTDRHVTKYVSGLGWTKVASGGHQGLKFRLNLPRQVFSDLGPADRAWVYDARTGRTVFGAAYLENPTPVDGASGQAYDISAVGAMALANDESRALVYIDRASDNWQPGGANPKGSNADWSAVPDTSISGGVPALLAQFPSGQIASTGDRVSLWYPFAGTDMEFGHATIGTISGKNDAGYQDELHFYNGTWNHILFGGSGGNISTTTTVGAPISGDAAWTAAGLPTTGITGIALCLARVGAPTNVADNETWTAWPQPNLSIHGRLLNRYGAQVVGSGLSSILASQVVEDLLGRLLTMCDPATALIDATSLPIDQLVYRDGAKAAAVLDDLAMFEPDFWWGMHESNDAGLHRFSYQQWPTDPRYVVSVADGWRQSGSDIDLCNRILVSWTDSDGKTQTVAITAASLGLTGMGLPVDALGSRVKDADPIDLPDGRGSYANALQIGAAVLRDKINPPRAGTVTVGRRIVDMVTGNLVAPWELEPGWPVVVREPGYQMRCTQVDYDHDSRSAVLTLGTPVLTESQRIARLSAA